MNKKSKEWAAAVDAFAAGKASGSDLKRLFLGHAKASVTRGAGMYAEWLKRNVDKVR